MYMSNVITNAYIYPRRSSTRFITAKIRVHFPLMQYFSIANESLLASAKFCWSTLQVTCICVLQTSYVLLVLFLILTKHRVRLVAYPTSDLQWETREHTI